MSASRVSFRPPAPPSAICLLSGVILAATLSFTSAPCAHAQGLDDAGGAIDVSGTGATPPPPTRELGKGSKVGRKAAEKYMGVQPNLADSAMGGTSAAHYLALHVGTFISDNAYQWGLPETQSNVGRYNVGVTYRVGEWVDSMDFAIRIDIQSFALGEGRANKISFLPLITFPDASSRFPLYFGAGIGPGVFMNQIAVESAVSIDYQLFAGVRFFDLVGTTGFFVEAGLKNHFLVFSTGQFNGTFVNTGAVFTF